MRIPKEIKTGDVLDLTKKDLIFIDACFSTSKEAEMSATRFMAVSRAAADRAWEVILKKWPKLGKYHLTINRENKSLVVSSEKGTLRSKT